MRTGCRLETLPSCQNQEPVQNQHNIDDNLHATQKCFRVVFKIDYNGQQERFTTMTSKRKSDLPNKNAMEVSFSTTVGDVAPILIFLQFPQPRKPVQHSNFELPWMHTIIAFNKRIS